jgi:site-specific DNA recombinase
LTKFDHFGYVCQKAAGMNNHDIQEGAAMRNALIYARVSTLTQKTNETIASQVKTLKAFCKAHGFQITHVYQDEGISGASEERVVAFVKFLTEQQHEIDCVVFTALDRMARDVYLQLWVEKECRKLGIELISSEQDLFNGPASDPVQNAMKQMMSVFAELEKNMITRRLANGRAYKAMQRGVKSQGNAPLGYAYVGKTTKDKHLVVNEAEAALVRTIFRTFLDTRSTTRTARALNAQGYTTPRGNAFSKQSVQRIVQNDFYTGVLTYTGTKRTGVHPPIISKHLFTKAQKLFS